jgi:hypothetical protein
MPINITINKEGITFFENIAACPVLWCNGSKLWDEMDTAGDI